MARATLWLTLFGGLAVANGAWALVDAAGWYALVAADTGPFNGHFVRDVGAAYVAVGAALLGAARVPAWRAPFLAAASVFLLLHGVGHVVETSRISPLLRREE